MMISPFDITPDEGIKRLTLKVGAIKPRRSVRRFIPHLLVACDPCLFSMVLSLKLEESALLKHTIRPTKEIVVINISGVCACSQDG